MTGDKRWERRTYHWRLRHTEASREDKDIIRRGKQNKLVGGKKYEMWTRCEVCNLKILHLGNQRLHSHQAVFGIFIYSNFQIQQNLMSLKRRITALAEKIRKRLAATIM